MALPLTIRTLQSCRILPIRLLTTRVSTRQPSQPTPAALSFAHLNSTKLFDVQREINYSIPRLSPPYELSKQNFNKRDHYVFSSLLRERESFEYVCPTKVKPCMEIFDIVNTVGMYDCPNNSKPDIDFILPTMQFFNDLDIDRECPGIQKPEKLARKKVRKCYRLLRTKERRMNRHKLKKMRKRLKFLLLKLKRHKKLKREKKITTEIKGIFAAVDDYDPLHKIQEDLKLARRGGYRIDIFAGMDEKK